MASSLYEALTRAFQAEGRRIAACRSTRAAQIRERIEALLRDGLMDGLVHKAYFGAMKFEPPASYGSEASLLVVATPHFKSVLILDLPGGLMEATIPSTYLADLVNERNTGILGTVLGPLGRAFERANVPLKTLAAFAGLGAYGKDNVLRVEGMGSYARLDAWWVDADLPEASWEAPKTLARCADCGACLRSCPNGCFREGVFSVGASRCLTFLNEGDGHFPVWLSPGAHSAAIGCLRCQEACPENARHRGSVERRFIFDPETSLAILNGRPAAELPPNAAELIRLLELEGHEKKLARNLSALMKQISKKQISKIEGPCQRNLRAEEDTC